MSSKSLRKSFILQHGQSDCGVACLGSIINFHGGEASLESLRKTSGTSMQGTTLLGLLQAAQQNGFSVEGLEAESVYNLKELSGPAILHVIIDSKLQHYVVFYGFEGDRIVMGDPAKGIITTTYEELNSIWQSKTLLKLIPNETFVKKQTFKQKKKSWIIGLIKEDINLLLISLFLGIVISVLGLTTAFFSQKLIDDFLPKGNSQRLVLSLVLVLLLLLARSGLGYIRGLFMIRQGMEFNNRIIQSFYGSLLQLPKSFFDTRKTGELIARMNDTRRIQGTLAVLAGSVLIDFLMIIISTCFVFAYSSIIGLLSLFVLLIYFAMLYGFSLPIADKQKEVMVGYAQSESNFVDSMQGIADIKLSNKHAFFEKVNNIVYGLFQQKSVELGRLGLRFGLVSEITGVIFIVLVLGISSWLVLNKQLLVGELVALLGMASGVIPSATRLILANIQIQEARIAFDRMFEFTAIKKEDQSGSIQLEQEINTVSIKDLSFRFPGRKQILKNVSLELRKGEMVALLGESGSGKSTLIQLIQKFYDPESGDILINDVSGGKISVIDVRRQIGSVPQEQKIFNGNLLLNITLSDSPEAFQNAIDFCEESGFGKFFQAFPQGYLTLLGEEGINISGGQKQLVVLARALFRNPQLLLLDEATSAMDRNTENFILALLQNLRSRMSILMVTHRIKTAQRCDRIYILEGGMITQSGSPEELMQTSNFYSQSYKELIS